MRGQLRTIKLNANPTIFIDATRTALSIVGLDQKYFKIFCIGFNKTGTSSINRCLKDAGINSIHSNNWCTKEPNLLQFFFRGFSDGSPVDFDYLDNRFPNSRFILNVRDLDMWLDSRREHAEHDRAREKYTDNPNWDVTDSAIEYWISERNEHHIRVMKYFSTQPDRLLIVNYIRNTEAPRQIAEFVNAKHIPEKAHVLPIKKLSQREAYKHKAQIESVLTRLSIPENEWKSDIFCQSLASEADRQIWPADTSVYQSYTSSR